MAQVANGVAKSSYVPRAGSVVERVWQAIEANGAATTAVLADLLDIDPSVIRACCAVAVREGCLAREDRGRTIVWSHGDGRPKKAPDDEEEEKPLKPSANRPPLTDGLAIDRILHSRNGHDAIELRTVRPEEWKGRAFACALWSDGRLQLVLDDREFVLAAEHTRELVRYLERMAEATA